MASSSNPSSSFTCKSKDPRIIDQKYLCSLNQLTQKKKTEGICSWGIRTGLDGRQENDRCKHPVVRVIESCEPMKNKKMSHDYRIKFNMNIMRGDLDTAKKALKTYAFFDWVTRSMATEDRHIAGAILIDVIGNRAFTDMRDRHPGYFCGRTEILETEYKQFVEDYEGTVKDDEWIPGRIAKELDRRMIEKAKSRHLWETEDSKINYPSTVSGPCHPIYCPAIPIEELSAATKIDLAGGWVIQGIEWAFDEPTA